MFRGVFSIFTRKAETEVILIDDSDAEVKTEPEVKTDQMTEPETVNAKAVQTETVQTETEPEVKTEDCDLWIAEPPKVTLGDRALLCLDYVVESHPAFMVGVLVGFLWFYLFQSNAPINTYTGVYGY